MPPSLKRYARLSRKHPWIEGLEDVCLRHDVIEALLAREDALELGGSEKEPRIRAADQAIESLRLGRVTGLPAWRRASYALRMFTQVYMRGYLRAHPEARDPRRPGRVRRS